MGLMPSWIIPADIQFYTLSFMFIFLYHKRPKLARSVTLITIILGMIVQAIYIRFKHYEAPFLTFAVYDLKTQVEEHIGVHVDTINYITSYFIGFLVAIIVHEKWLFCHSDYYFFRGYRLAFALVTSSICSWSYLWGYSFKFREVTSFEMFVYGSLVRTMMAVATGALLYWNCTYNDRLRAFLTNRVFSFLGQFNYSIYMGHFLFMYLDVYSTKQPLEYSFWPIMTRTVYVLIFGIAFGYFIHILFEAPFVRLSRYIFADSIKSKSQEPVVIRTDSPIKESETEDEKDSDLSNNNIEQSRSPIKFPTPPSMRDYRRKID
jgi:peptidoglycan/LPS O-acetylase OafA/YrhL